MVTEHLRTAQPVLAERLRAAQPHVIGLFRIVFGLLFALHGISSLFGVLGGAEGTHGGSIPVTSWPVGWGSLIQLVCGILLILGLGTRWAALIASGSMAFGYFYVHQPVALWPIENNGESSVLYCWAFLLLIFTGPGAFALDRLLARGKASRSPNLSSSEAPSGTR